MKSQSSTMATTALKAGRFAASADLVPLGHDSHTVAPAAENVPAVQMTGLRLASGQAKPAGHC